jgi:hypothetical protein
MATSCLNDQLIKALFSQRLGERKAVHSPVGIDTASLTYCCIPAQDAESQELTSLAPRIWWSLQ